MIFCYFCQTRLENKEGRVHVKQKREEGSAPVLQPIMLSKNNNNSMNKFNQLLTIFDVVLD